MEQRGCNFNEYYSVDVLFSKYCYLDQNILKHFAKLLNPFLIEILKKILFLSDTTKCYPILF